MVLGAHLARCTPRLGFPHGPLSPGDPASRTHLPGPPAARPGIQTPRADTSGSARSLSPWRRKAGSSPIGCVPWRITNRVAASFSVPPPCYRETGAGRGQKRSLSNQSARGGTSLLTDQSEVSERCQVTLVKPAPGLPAFARMLAWLVFGRKRNLGGLLTCPLSSFPCNIGAGFNFLRDFWGLGWAWEIEPRASAICMQSQ